jgi:crotonobetainyl-CoA:carnitine CoA-transferase CaiB-like acyl-CoA transferase
MNEMVKGSRMALSGIRIVDLTGGGGAEMGFDLARLNALNPALILTSVDDYGSTGPYADRPF